MHNLFTPGVTLTDLYPTAFKKRLSPPVYKETPSATALTIDFDHIFDYVSYYDYCDGIRGFISCTLKRDLCAELKKGMVVDDIVMYTDGWLEIYIAGLKYILQIMLSTPQVLVKSGVS